MLLEIWINKFLINSLQTRYWSIPLPWSRQLRRRGATWCRRHGRKEGIGIFSGIFEWTKNVAGAEGAGKGGDARWGQKNEWNLANYQLFGKKGV